MQPNALEITKSMITCHVLWGFIDNVWKICAKRPTSYLKCFLFLVRQVRPIIQNLKRLICPKPWYVILPIMIRAFTYDNLYSCFLRLQMEVRLIMTDVEMPNMLYPDYGRRSDMFFSMFKSMWHAHIRLIVICHIFVNMYYLNFELLLGNARAKKWSRFTKFTF